jgi:hypothetical protein
MSNIIYFFVYDFKMFLLNNSVFPYRPLQPRIMLVGKTEAYPSEAPFRCSTLGYSLLLTTKINLSRKALRRLGQIP